MMKRFLLVTVWVLFIQSLFADIPTGYYDSADGLTGDALKSALHDIIDDHTVKTYADLWTILKESDEDPNNTDNFILIYTGRSISKTNVYPAWNREHVWAKSHGFPDESDYAYTDAHHLRPCDVSVNSDRGNKDFDNGGAQHSEATECYWDSDSWEPRDAVKGDVARMMFYMVVRYEGDGGASDDYDLELVDYVGTSGVNFGKLSTLLDWHNQDPVDDMDRQRNEVVYSYQNNRNPFIDHPEYVAEIWGSGGNSAPSITNISISPTNPTSSDAVSVSATITDSDGTISNAELHWGLSSGSLTNTISMSISSGDSYATDSDIPAQTNGTTVFYEIEATDDEPESNTTSEKTYTVSDGGSTNELLNESFDSLNDNDEITLTGWLVIAEVGTRDWIGKVFSENHYIQATAYLSTDDSNIMWALTPEIDYDNYSSELLSFKSAMAYWDHAGLSVWIVQDLIGEDISSATKTEITANLAIQTSGNHAWVESGDVDLSGISGPARIGFKYEGLAIASEETTFRIDDVVITGDEISNNAPSITNIANSPVVPIEGEDVTVSATITDSDGTITSANIKWGTSTGNYPNTVSMSNSGDVYSGVISAQAGETTVYYIIEATDDEPETTQSGENNFTFNEIPIITEISNFPISPTEGENVTVSATITDPDGTISLAEIKWGTSTGNYPNTVSMSNSGDDYSGVIPSQAGGTTIYYIIEATDDDTETTQSGENSFSFSTIGNVLPEISDVGFTPADPESTESVSISATIIDSDGTITTANIKWGISTGNYPNTVSMTNTGDAYSGAIPSQADKAHVYFVIYTVDNDGGSAQSSENDYVVDDPNILPEITDVGFTPTDPESTEAVSVSATITDSDGSVTTADIKWGISTGNYPNTVSMTNSGDDYSGLISAQADGTEVFFIIEAEDNEAGVTLSSEFNYTVEDSENQAPVISDVMLDPASPTEDENLIVSCIVDDSDGSVVVVVLKWKRGAGDYTDVSMNFSGGRYYGQIPKQSVGETIYFTITAEDNEGLQSNYESSYEISESNSINDQGNSSLKIYPNPTRNNINIEFAESGFINSIKVYNLIGEKMLEMSNLNAVKYTVELSQFPKGIYILQVNDSENSIVRKVMLK